MRRGAARSDKAKRGVAGLARRGMARIGRAKRGKARPGGDWHGRHG